MESAAGPSLVYVYASPALGIVFVQQRVGNAATTAAPLAIHLGASDIDPSGGGFTALLDDYAFLLE